MKKMLMIPLLATSLLASDDFGMLLDTFAAKSDLSNKTKLENSGIYHIFTRQDMERMQIRELKDVFKFISYQVSGYGLPDMNYNQYLGLAFNSSSIRLFLDDQEITSAVYGSGLAQMGDMDLSFVDHIELYSPNPTFEYSSEPALMMIKLFSMDAERDRGGRLGVTLGSRGYDQESVVYADTIGEWSVTGHASHTDDRKKGYTSFSEPLSRDQKMSQIFLAMKQEGHKFQGTLFKKESDAFINMSLDATPTVAESEYDYYAIGYENSVFENLTFLINFENEQSYGNYADDNVIAFSDLGPVYSFLYRTDDTIVTSELKYHFNRGNHALYSGLKYRYKKFDPQETKLGGIDYPDPAFDAQRVASAYLEDQYTLDDQNMLTFGFQYGNVNQNGGEGNYDISLLRLGYTFTAEAYSVKMAFFRSEYLIEPYLMLSNFTDPANPLQPQKARAASFEAKHTAEKHHERVMLLYIDYLNPYMRSGQYIVNSDVSMQMIAPAVEFTYNFDVNNRIDLRLFHLHFQSDMMPSDTKKDNVVIRSLNTIGRFDLFNELTYVHSNERTTEYYDYTIGINYRYSDALTFSLKGENILDKAYETEYLRNQLNVTFNPPPAPPTIVHVPLESLYIAPNDPKFMVSMKYLF